MPALTRLWALNTCYCGDETSELVIMQCAAILSGFWARLREAGLRRKTDELAKKEIQAALVVA